MKKLILVLSLLLSCGAASALAQASSPPPYGAPVSHADSKRIMAAAMAEAVKNKWNVAIAIVDSGGHLVLFERMDNVQFGSVGVAQGKAQTSAAFRRATKAFQDTVAAGGEGLRTLAMTGVTPLEGGVPLLLDGKIIGAIGVSGVTSAQDAQIATAGAGVLLK
jgi:glc operon protein GlcG